MESNTTPATDHQSFAALLQSAITNPGKIHAGYSAFWNYSIGNQLAAIGQCWQRGITPGPIATFVKWKTLGRYVRKGEKALVLCQPVTIKRKAEKGGAEKDVAFTRFIWKASWFTMSQTDGEPFTPALPPSWDRARALTVLGIEEIPFTLMDGNSLGFARAKQIAVSPVSPMPERTLLHEIAHVVLGHTLEHIEQDGPATPRSLREVEAEGVAFLCSSALGIEGAEYSRGYLQHWLGGNEIPERSAQRILKVADQILRAGRPQPTDGTEAAS